MAVLPDDGRRAHPLGHGVEPTVLVARSLHPLLRSAAVEDVIRGARRLAARRLGLEELERLRRLVEGDESCVEEGLLSS